MSAEKKLAEALDVLQLWAEWHYQRFGDGCFDGPIAETSAILKAEIMARRNHAATKESAR